MLQVTFPEIVEVMRSAGSTVPAAEGHGCLCGALCMSADYTLERWLEEVVPAEDGGVAQDVELPMRTLYSDTVRALRGDDMDFEPFLPDDSVALEQRAVALSQWCQGFLYGLGTARKIEAEHMPKSIDEILTDFTAISRAQVETSDDAEEDEQSYTEVVEYVRAAVQLIHDELDDVRSGEVSQLDHADDCETDPDPDSIH
ncbi:MAG TPA: UPF0149 family protein [Povalibacter sp.]|nr:UPF0149 family protein [Povalibacter sp.]